MKLANLRAAVDSAFGHSQYVVGNAAGQVGQRIQADLKGLEVTAVYPDDVRSAIQRPLQFLLVVDLAQSVEIERAGTIEQTTEAGVVESRQDQQDSIGMVGPGFSDLKFID